MAQNTVSFQRSAHPAQAEARFSEFLTAHDAAFKSNLEGHKIDKNFRLIFGNSSFLERLVIQHPEYYESYITSAYKTKEKPLRIFLEETAQIKHDSLQELKKYKYQELLRLTIKELSHCDQMITYREMSYLARALTIKVTKNRLTTQCEQFNVSPDNICDFCLLAMGKLGGNELNYSSDIDLIGAYNQDDSFGQITAHEFFVKLFAHLGKDLSSQDQHGFLYRVDWDLRPEGRSGTLANSIKALEIYYTTFGEEWERQAYIKSDEIFSLNTLGQDTLKMLSPFVYRKTFDQKTIENIWNMKAKILTELKSKRSDGINIKLDAGGIRDIEFFVQGFQLLYGGRIPTLRSQNTLTALNELVKNDLITTKICKTLQSSYLFLRRLESCLQMDEERQTHVVKSQTSFKEQVARRMSLDVSSNDIVALFDETLFRVRNAVKTLFENHYQTKGRKT